jgi:hypothetical protein
MGGGLLSLFLSLFFVFFFLLDYDRFSSVSSILSGRIVNHGKPNCSSNVNTAIERERLSPTGTKIAKEKLLLPTHNIRVDSLYFEISSLKQNKKKIITFEISTVF